MILLMSRLPGGPAQVCQTTCTAVWNQSRRPSDSLQAAAEEVQWSCSRLHMVYGFKDVYHRTTIQLSEWPGLCTSRIPEATHWFQLSYARRLWYPLPCHKRVWLNLSTLGWRWTASITATSCCLSRCFQQSNMSQNVVYSQNNMLLTVKFVIFVFCDFPR